MSLNAGARLRHTAGFPRVSGDEPFPVYAPFLSRAFSPRERG